MQVRERLIVEGEPVAYGDDFGSVCDRGDCPCADMGGRVRRNIQSSQARGIGECVVYRWMHWLRNKSI